MNKKLSGNQAAIKVLNDLLKLSPEELHKKIEEHSKGPKHWITEALEHTGYFERLVQEKKMINLWVVVSEGRILYTADTKDSCELFVKTSFWTDDNSRIIRLEEVK